MANFGIGAQYDWQNVIVALPIADLFNPHFNVASTLQGGRAVAASPKEVRLPPWPTRGMSHNRLFARARAYALTVAKNNSI